LKKIGFIFSHTPHATAQGREGLDAILAASAYSEDIAIFFVAEGVNQLLKQQQPQQILSRDYISAFKLLDLYDVEQIYVCEQSLQDQGITQEDLLIDCLCMAADELSKQMHSCDQLVRF
jgi:tRNA 2-thiouridine synthesizing protein C